MVETTETIHLGDLAIAFTRKAVRNVHLSVHPPEGHVTMVAPETTRLEVARAYAISRLGWIRAQQARFVGQARETPRAFVERESHYVWGRRYLMSVVERDVKPSVQLRHHRITLTVRPGTTREGRREVLHAWHRSLLHVAVPPLVRKWEARIGVTARRYFLQRMKTKWGSCNAAAGHIRLNTELARKPKDLLEYVIAHELVHLLEPSHNARFVALMNHHYPTWQTARAELNDLPLGPELWRVD